MKVGELQELNDGSGTIELEMNNEERDILINHAVNDILRKHLDLMRDVETKKEEV